MAVSDLSELKPVYLIHGSEELLLERAVKRLRDKIAAVADLDFNMETFEGETSTADAIVAAANTMPFMSERRLVIVRDVDKLPADGAALLAEYAKDPAPYTCLVLVATKANKNGKLYRAVNAAGGAFEYAAPKRYEYPNEVVRMFADHGKRADRAAAEVLVEAVGRDLRRLESEVDKIATFVGASEAVTQADVETVTASAVAPSVFEYLDAVGDRDAALALRRLRAMLRAGEAVMGIHAMSVRHVRNLLGARSLMDRGTSPSEMAPMLGMAPWQVGKVVGQAANFEPAELTRALRAAAASEAEMKTSPVDAGLVLERWVIRTCRG